MILIHFPARMKERYLLKIQLPYHHLNDSHPFFGENEGDVFVKDSGDVLLIYDDVWSMVRLEPETSIRIPPQDDQVVRSLLSWHLKHFTCSSSKWLGVRSSPRRPLVSSSKLTMVKKEFRYKWFCSYQMEHLANIVGYLQFSPQKGQMVKTAFVFPELAFKYRWGWLPVLQGLPELKASASNIRRIQVKDIVKEVEDNLKTYSSAGMDISWYVEGIHCGSKKSQMWQYSDYPITL
ncbi:hypothetical protein Tco_0687317 [Tanacetum coccineum]